MGPIRVFGLTKLTLKVYTQERLRVRSESVRMASQAGPGSRPRCSNGQQQRRQDRKARPGRLPGPPSAPDRRFLHMDRNPFRIASGNQVRHPGRTGGVQDVIHGRPVHLGELDGQMDSRSLQSLQALPEAGPGLLASEDANSMGEGHLRVGLVKTGVPFAQRNGFLDGMAETEGLLGDAATDGLDRKRVGLGVAEGLEHFEGVGVEHAAAAWPEQFAPLLLAEAPLAAKCGIRQRDVDGDDAGLPSKVAGDLREGGAHGALGEAAIHQPNGSPSSLAQVGAHHDPGHQVSLPTGG